MLHCNDIDGLMIDWLYGELDDAASHEVSGHVDACARCQAEQAAFSRTRDLFRELPAEEPAPSLTAMLIREAALSAAPVTSAAAAPVTGTSRGFGAWISRLFQPLMHPAFAAVATLVLVVGVAGTLYLQSDGDDQFAESSVQSADKAAAGDTSLAAAVEEPEAKVASKPAALAPPTEVAADLGDDQPAGDPSDATRTADLLDSNRESALRGLEQNTKAKKKRPARTKIATAKSGAVVGTRGASKNDRRVRQQKPPPSPRFDLSKDKKRDAETEADEDSFAGDGATPNSAAFRGGRPGSDSWAQSLENKLTGAYKRSDCREAARLANDIRERNPSYYKKNTSDLAAVKKCRYYVNSERKRRTARARKAAKSKAGGKTGPKNAAPAEQADAVEVE